MSLRGHSSREGLDHEPPVCEVHKKDRKATDRRYSLNRVSLLTSNKASSGEKPENKKLSSSALSGECYQQSY